VPLVARHGQGALSVAVSRHGPHNNVVEVRRRSGGRDVLGAMAKEAVDRAGGQLEVLLGEEFVDDDLLKYIGGRYDL
jgi:hypothetical protein